MFNKRVLAGAIASFVACSSFAEESKLSYTSINLRYETAEIVDADFSGFDLGGSVALNDSVFMSVSYNSMSSHDDVRLVLSRMAASAAGTSGDIEVTAFRAGIGFHTPVNENVDFVTLFSYLDSEVGLSGISEDVNGYGIELGLRSKPTDVLELGASINYADMGGESSTSFSVGARYFLQPTVSLGLGYGTADDVDVISFSARFDF